MANKKSLVDANSEHLTDNERREDDVHGSSIRPEFASNVLMSSQLHQDRNSTPRNDRPPKIDQSTGSE